jgi:hypothetical protein
MADEGKSGGENPSIDRTLIARRAYERYQQRGDEHGRDLHDWYEAERELIAAQHEEE